MTQPSPPTLTSVVGVPATITKRDDLTGFAVFDPPYLGGPVGAGLGGVPMKWKNSAPVGWQNANTNAALQFPLARNLDGVPAPDGWLYITLTWTDEQGRRQEERLTLFPVADENGQLDLTKKQNPVAYFPTATLLELEARANAAAARADDVVAASQQAANRANAAADRAEDNTFEYKGRWTAGVYPQGSVVVYRDTVWRAKQSTEAEPLDGSPVWDVLVPRGPKGLPGEPSTLNGFSTARLSLYTGVAYPASEDSPSTWPRGIRTFDIRNGTALAYPFSEALLTSYGAEDGTTTQEALVTETLNNEVVTTLWLRSSSGVNWRPWRKGAGGESGLDLKRLSPSSRLVNGSGELGTTGWTQLGDAVGFWGGYTEVSTGTVLEYYRVGQPAAVLAANTGVYQEFAYSCPTGQVYVTVDSVAQLGNARLYIDFYKASGGAPFETVNVPLTSGIATYGPFGQASDGGTGIARVYLLHPAGSVGDILSRFRIGVAQLQPPVPNDTRRSIRAVYDDVQVLKNAPPATAQLVENSRTSAQAAVDFPTGLSYMPTTGNGWPFAGVVETVRPSTTAAATAHRQTIRQNGGTGIQQRTSTAVSPFWTPWSVLAEKGTRGTMRFKDYGAPSAVVIVGALDGDEYLNLQNGDLYIRAGGVWPASPALNLKGITGVSSYTRERRTGGVPGCLCVLINNVWVVASNLNSVLELDTWGVLGSDNVMYAPGAEAVVDNLGFLPGMFYYLGPYVNGKNLYPFSSQMPTEMLATQAQRQFSPCSTPKGVSNRLFLNPAAEPISVEPTAQVYRVTPLSFPVNQDLGPAGLNKMIRNIDQPRAGQTVGSGYSLRVMQDGNTGNGTVASSGVAATGQNAVGQPSPHVTVDGKAVFLRAFEFDNTFHMYTPVDFPETDNGELLVAWQHSNVALYRPGVGFVATGDHTSQSLYTFDHTGTQAAFRKRTMNAGAVSEVTLGTAAAKAVANYTIMLTRVRKQDAEIKARTWVAPAGWQVPGANLQEPTTWDKEITDGTIVGAGRWGMISRHDFLRIHAMSLATLDGAASF